MKLKRISLLVLVLLAILIKPSLVKAEGKEVHWKAGGSESTSLREFGVNDYITKVVFNDVSKTKERIIVNVKKEKDISLNNDNSVVLTITYDNIAYIQFEGTLYFNENSSYTFYYLPGVTEIEGLEYINTSIVTNMNNMFGECKSLISLDLSSFNTSNVVSTTEMFYNCKKIISINLGGWDTSKVTRMSGMFENCENLKELNVNHFNTSNVTNMGSMFRNCKSLETIDVSNFNTSKVTGIGGMFSNCKKLTKLDLSNWDLSSMTNSCTLNTLTHINEIKTPKNFGSCTEGLDFAPSSIEYIDENGNIYKKTNSIGSILTPNVTLKETRTITYNGEKQTKKIAYDAENYGELLTPSKEGTYFIGWYDNKYFRGEIITSDSMFEGEDITLYPKFANSSQNLYVYWNENIGQDYANTLVYYLVKNGIDLSYLKRINKI